MKLLGDKIRTNLFFTHYVVEPFLQDFVSIENIHKFRKQLSNFMKENYWGLLIIQASHLSLKVPDT